MKRMHITTLLSLVLIIVSCRKDAVKNLDSKEGIVYVTDHDSSVNFSNYLSFRIADSVSVIRDGQLVGREYDSYESGLITALSQALTQRGFQLETDHTEQPDIGINITKLVTNQTGVISYYDYWGGYNSYWDPYYWGYGGYDYYFPYAIGTYTFQQAALSIDMLDLKNPDTAGNKLHSIWTGLVYGSGIFNSNNVNELVQNLFNQSPYLQH
jgi:hypothetical protein